MPKTQRSPMLRDPIVRLLVLFLLLGAAIVWTYWFVVPETYKDPEFQVAAVIAREVARTPRYAGAATCAMCHSEQDEQKVAGYHRALSCETCHGAGQEHADDPTGVRMAVPRQRDFCPTCHAYDPSRPLGFPQINVVMHNPLDACVKCHNPHDPKPPIVPSRCAACHSQIERTKAVSHHARLECTTCHSVPEEHRVTPRLVRAEKPADRAFCGRCHGPDSRMPEAPRVEMETHEPKYLCWQCHYPHMPEVD